MKEFYIKTAVNGFIVTFYGNKENDYKADDYIFESWESVIAFLTKELELNAQ